MNELLGYLIGWGIVAAVISIMVNTLRAIYRELGFASVEGFSWALAVIVGNLFGVILYHFFRIPMER